MSRKIECPMCKSDGLQLLIDKVRFGNKADVYKCRNCTLTFLDQSSFSFSKDFYEKEYHQTYITHVEPDALHPQLYYEKMKKATKIWADKFRDILTGQEIVLDVGCSTGHFIDLVKDKTRKIYGHELSRKEVDFCRDVLNLDVSNQALEERFEEQTFDYIVMIYVLEHIAEPKQFLKSIKKLLKPKGKMVILIPNVQDALLNFYNIPEFRSFYYCIEHIFYYNPQTIKWLFDEVGLQGEIEVIQEYPLINHLNWTYRRAPSDTLTSRNGMPDVPLIDVALDSSWNELWNKFNQLYQTFLKDNGFGDRIWCTVGINK